MTPAQVADHIRKALDGLVELQRTAPQHPNPLLNPRRHLSVAITHLEDVQGRLAVARTYAAGITNGEIAPEAEEPAVEAPTDEERIAILNPRLPR